MTATEEQITQRVKENDIPRTDHRTKVATQVGELAQRRSEVAEQLARVEQELGDVLAESRSIISLDELARFTDVPVEDLGRWRGDEKPHRAKRKKPTAGSSRSRSLGQPNPMANASANGAPPESAEAALSEPGTPVQNGAEAHS
ncbi:hypothetical protein [Amycolatopsis sp. WGS_07]|uniref:hypothetical protein n=1 Tax=Amycolatopsis sp. WGS_07 TaxID=3076764 RepID=UPI0038739569